jgi:hypothetical protein
VVFAEACRSRAWTVFTSAPEAMAADYEVITNGLIESKQGRPTRLEDRFVSAPPLGGVAP